MEFQQLRIDGAWLVTTTPVEDERGSFTRLWCAEHALARSLPESIVQLSQSFNHRRGTLRGMHYQAEPHGEEKWVRCIAGAIYDVLLDLRPKSPTYLQSQGLELSGENLAQVYIPRGVAHGFITLADQSVVLYGITTPFEPAAARGVRWNDPAFGIQWPLEPKILSERDANYPLFDQQGMRCQPSTLVA